MSENKNDLLVVKNLKKYFKTKSGLLHAVDDVSFTIGRGRTLGVVGESVVVGVGKIHFCFCLFHILYLLGKNSLRNVCFHAVLIPYGHGVCGQTYLIIGILISVSAFKTYRLCRTLCSAGGEKHH